MENLDGTPTNVCTSFVQTPINFLFNAYRVDNPDVEEKDTKNNSGNLHPLYTLWYRADDGAFLAFVIILKSSLQGRIPVASRLALVVPSQS